MSDNRVLEADASSSLSQAVYINSLYARLQGYGFLYVQSGLAQPQAQAQAPGSRNASQAKDAASCYCARLQQARAASWCKLQAVYAVLQSRPEVQYVWFLDSDCVVSAYWQRLELWLAAVETLLPGCSGAELLLPAAASNCSLLFLGNAPANPHTPNAGQWLARRGRWTQQFLRHWWHQSLPSKNFAHAYEQDALHAALRRMPPAARNAQTGVVLEPSLYHASAMQLTHHWAHGDAHRRRPYFARLIKDMQRDPAFAARGIATAFSAVIARVLQQHSLRLDTAEDRIPPPDQLRTEGAEQSW